MNKPFSFPYIPILIMLVFTALLLGWYWNAATQPQLNTGAYVGSTLDLQVDTSSFSALSNGASSTTGWIDRGGYTGIKVAFSTDQNGYFTIEYSPDGVNVDSTLTRYYRTDQIEPPHKFENMRRYVRVTFYNNSGSNQTYLRTDITLTNSGNALNIPIDATISQDYDSISVRPTQFNAECALGRRQNCSTWNKFGYDEDVDDAEGEELIAEFGSNFAPTTTPTTLRIVSTSAQDSLTGTGTRQIIIYGVDENWDEQIAIQNLEGTTPTTTTTQWIGVNRMAIYSSGSGISNAGLITASSTYGVIMAEMPAGQGTTQQCLFYVPNQTQFLADWLYLNALKAGPATAPIVLFKGYVYSDVVDARFEVFRTSVDTANQEAAIFNPAEYFVIGEKSILWFTADSDQNNTSVRCRFSGKLIKDVDA